jgi:hypothetical protein
MASFEDAAAGWVIFRNRDGSVSMPQLNQALRALGKEPISLRTYAHYGKLMRLGYSEYVSINRLDLRHSNESIFDLADRSRYVDRDLGSPGRLVLPTGAGLEVIAGTIGKLSEGFATLRSRRTQEALTAARATRYNRGVLIFDQVGVERAVKVVEGTDAGEELDLLLEFRSLLETDLIFDASPFPVTTSHLRVDLGADASIYRVLSAVHTTFDLFESVRGIVELVSTVDGGGPPPLPILRVRHLEFLNPFEAWLHGSTVVYNGVNSILEKVSSLVDTGTNAASKVQALRHAEAAERRREDFHQLEMQSMRLDNLKKAVEVSQLIEELRPAFESVEGVEIPQIDAARAPRIEALKDQAVEAAAELRLKTHDPITLERVED